MINCLHFEIRIKSSDFDDLKGTTVSLFVYAVFPSPDVYMEGAMYDYLDPACTQAVIDHARGEGTSCAGTYVCFNSSLAG